MQAVQAVQAVQVVQPQEGPSVEQKVALVYPLSSICPAGLFALYVLSIILPIISAIML